jgi:hypothetical protein
VGSSLSQRCCIVFFLLIASASRSSFAQPVPPLTVDEVVARLQANLDTYENSIPSFVVDEHIDSIAQQFAARGASAPNYETIAESVFHLKRNIDPANHTVTLDESRAIRILDGKPANGADINAPSMIYGAFSGGLAMVSTDEHDCMRYQLEPIKPRKPIVVRFVRVSVAERPDGCILAEDGSGRVTIDPASMQITHIEIHVPHHLLNPVTSDGHKVAPVMTRWDVRVTYRPVVLNARTFWLPATISSTCSNEQTEWSFRGDYRNYHLLDVHSRIVVPGSIAP